MQAPLLSVTGISKSFGDTKVLDAVSFDLLAGEVHAIVGENGAGKSTLMNILSGVVSPDTGSVTIDGAPVQFDNPRAAQLAGIGTVFQELSLMPELSVAENVFPNRAPVRRGLIRWKQLHDATRDVLATLGVHVDPRTPVDRLPTSTRQLVEIAKALSLDARVLILDEPTSALTPDEVEALSGVIARLKARGIGLVYISHHLHEIFSLSDRITVLRDGRRIDTMKTADTTHDDVVRKMVGREMASTQLPRATRIGLPAIEARKLSHAPHFNDIDLTLRRGEIVGLAGLAGCGRSELGQVLAGVQAPSAGELHIDNAKRHLRGIHDAMALGIAYLPAERKTQGLFLEQSIADNVIAASLDRFAHRGMIAYARRDEVAEAQRRSLNVRSRDIQQPVGRLSGGNQQKVLLAKWLLTDPHVLIIDEPTRGIDIGAKLDIHKLLRDRAEQGMAILVISSDLPELLGLCDRILVMHAGALSGDLSAAQATEDDIMRCAVGAARISFSDAEHPLS
ncbi:sugar ABC transporter ATP-binding protein [Pararobbsia silviterrae]|uniref:Sugar ABC transporter ATP-binding protein n=1 Tax=Pararobbsia silviterrae TaxID=1792498 RepID=A0A494XUT1_9BURK|nr:sugar ABC transporter ATP-binding protein [Pararobbsia silviterrae]RKP51864.1 sugar ABC transporter ATP-binding protein [Pararobbsia silviterrae]